ncbi:MAG: hypothetical protein ACR2I0_02590, partial [Rhodoferax sp.]
MRRLTALIALITLAVLAGCAAPKYTVDDGRKVNEELLAQIRTYGAGESVLRPAIARSAALREAECDTQWELPFAVASAYDLSMDDRVAWVRGLGVDERLTVVGNAANSPLQLRDKIQAIGSYSSENSEKMLLELADMRDAGRPFSVTLFGGKKTNVVPFKVCRGYTRLAPPNLPRTQDYHWLMSMHPLQVAGAQMNADEALWLVLWTQGVSEEGGARMKTYHYGSKVAGTLYNLFTIATGLKGAAIAADAAVKAAQSAAAGAATELMKQQIVSQASSYATDKMREQLFGAARTLTQAQVVDAMQQAAANRGSLSGVAWVASTVFEKADAWAYTRLEKLDADPLAGFSLHQKLIVGGWTANAMVFDQERMTALSKLVDERGRGDALAAVLGGFRPEDLHYEVASMPLASRPTGFSYDDPDGAASSQPYAHGLID